MHTRPYRHRVPIRAWQTSTIGLAAVTVACGALGGIAFSRPTTQAGTETVTYTHHGRFAYTAPAPAGAVYDGKIRTGDPVFLQLVHAVNVTFDYRLDSPARHAVAGTVALRAEITGNNGWHHTLELDLPTDFDGSRARATATLDIAELQAIVAEVQATTGVHEESHVVTLIAETRLDGAVEGQALDDLFAPRLDFQLDPRQLRLINPATDAAPGGTHTDPLTLEQPGSLRQKTKVPAELKVLGLGIGVVDARRGAVGTGLAAALGALVTLTVLARRLRGEVARIELRHGHRLVPVVAAERESGNAIVDVTTMDDLARLAEQHGSLILHHKTPTSHDFVFQADRTVYRYRVHAATS